MPVPKQLLCLMPPPPEAGGWPSDFILATVVEEIKALRSDRTRDIATRPPAPLLLP